MKPLNRHLLVIPVEEKKENKTQSAFVLPEDYQKEKPKYVIMKVAAKAEDCSIGVNVLDRVVVESSMVQEINVGPISFSLVLENYVYGVWEKQ